MEKKILYLASCACSIFASCTRIPLTNIPKDDGKICVRSSFLNTKLSHSEDIGLLRTFWEKGDTITIVSVDKYWYYVADGSGKDVTFSLSGEQTTGLTGNDGQVVYAITGHREIKDGFIALLGQSMGSQSYSRNSIPLDFMVASTVITNKSVNLVFSYPHSYLKIDLKKKDIVQSGYKLAIGTAEYSFLIKGMDDHVNDNNVLQTLIFGSRISEENWGEESSKYRYQLFNVKDNNLINSYGSMQVNGKDYYTIRSYTDKAEAIYYSFPNDQINTFSDEDTVSFYVAVLADDCPGLVSIYPSSDVKTPIYQKIVPSETIVAGTIYHIGLADPYISTDFSKDGECTQLQKATKGKGIDLVIMGNGYYDRDMDSGGRYETDMNGTMEALFRMEPYKSYRDRFNVFAVKVVSPYIDANRKDSPIGSLSSVRAYYKRVPGIDTTTTRVVIIERIPKNRNQINRSNTIMFSDCSFIINMKEHYNNSNVLLHEFSHGIGKVCDEYIEHTGIIPEEQKWVLRVEHQKGWMTNVDLTNSKDSVLWKAYLTDDRFKMEGLGIFEGGNTYEYGVYRSSSHSAMNGRTFWLNAPSRECIYRQIMSLSEGDSWVFNYEDFVSFDAPYRSLYKDGNDTVIDTKSHITGEDASSETHQHVPPKYIDKPINAVSSSERR